MAEAKHGWTHYSMTYSESTGKLRLYRDGFLAESKEIGKEIKLSRKNLEIGNKFSGKIDEVRIYNRSLNKEEIKHLAFH